MLARTRGVLGLVPALAILLAAPASAAAQTEEEAIRQRLVEMWSAIENGVVVRYATCIHDDFTSFGETDTYLNDGKAYELRSVEGWVSRNADIHTEMHQPQVTVRGDTAWITYYWTDQSIDRQTGERGTSRGKSTRIFVKENGRWLCIHGHYTLVE
jgi:ketosteroid isomerase-like protein